MKAFEVVLGKSYKVIIKAENAEFAREFSQIFTSDVQDLSSHQDREKHKFSIEDIDCKINEVFEVKEINESN